MTGKIYHNEKATPSRGLSAHARFRNDEPVLELFA